MGKPDIIGLTYETHEVLRNLGLAYNLFDVGKESSKVSGGDFRKWAEGHYDKARKEYRFNPDELVQKVMDLMRTSLDSNKRGSLQNINTWKAGWFLALSETEQDVYNNSLAAIEDVIRLQNSVDIGEDGVISYDKWEWEDEQRAITVAMEEWEQLRQSTIMQRYEHHSFEVVQSTRVEEDVAIRMLARFDLVERALEEFGCGHLLYGRLILTDNIGSGKWRGRGGNRRKVYSTAAHYVIAADEVQMGQHVTTGRPDRSTAVVCHELGHRHWFKAMNASDRKAFTEHVTYDDGDLKSPTAYGQKNAEECFAEWFMVYSSGFRQQDEVLYDKVWEKRGDMSRSIFRRLARLDEDHHPDDYVPGFSNDAVLVELQKLPDQTQVFLLTIMETPELAGVRRLIDESDGRTDARIVNAATEQVRAAASKIWMAAQDGAYPNLIKAAYGVQDILQSRGLESIALSAVRIYISKTLSPGSWPDPDPELILSRKQLEDKEEELADNAGFEFGDDIPEALKVDWTKIRRKLDETGVATHDVWTFSVIPHPEGGGFAIKRENVNGDSKTYPDKMSMTDAKEFAVTELRNILAHGVRDEGAVKPVEAKDLVARNLKLGAGPDIVLKYVGGLSGASGVSVRPDANLFLLNTKTTSIQMHAKKRGDSHRFFRPADPKTWEGKPFKLLKGDVLYTTDAGNMLFYVVTQDHDLNKAIGGLALPIEPVGRSWRSGNEIFFLATEEENSSTRADRDSLKELGLGDDFSDDFEEDAEEIEPEPEDQSLSFPVEVMLGLIKDNPGQQRNHYSNSVP